MVMLRQLRITRSLIPRCPTSGAVYGAPLRCVRVGGEWTPSVPPNPTCGLQWLYAVTKAHEKPGSQDALILAWVHWCRSLPMELFWFKENQQFPSLSCPDSGGARCISLGNHVAGVHVPKPG